jgi:predicted RNase H-like HicB family nuclease
MKHYLAIFTKITQTVEVKFPDLEGCLTFGKDWEEELKHAEDLLASWLAHTEAEFIKDPSKHHKLKHLSGDIVTVALNKYIIASYQKPKC